VVVTLAPFDRKFAAGQRNLDDAIGPPEPRRGDGGGAGRRAAGLCQSGATLPGTDGDVIAIDDMRQRDISALREDR